MIDLKDLINNNKILNTLKPFFSDEPVYLVGGFIRDCLLNKESCDLDFVTQFGHAQILAKKIADEIGGYFVPLDEKNHIYRVVFSDKETYVDFADCIGDNIQEDLSRRDFTMNAIAYDIKEDKIIDIANGIADINSSMIVEVSEKNLLDDPIRMFRAFRFQSELGFEFSPVLKNMIQNNFYLLKNTAKERINAELIKLFGGKNIVETLYSLDKYNILEMIFPEVADIKKIPKNSHHHLNLFEHSIETVKQIQCFYEQSDDNVKKHLNSEFLGGQRRIAYLKLAAFLHDAGKPATWQIDSETGRHRFIMHDVEGAKLIVPTLKDLKFSKKQIAYIQKIIKNHIYPAGVVTSDEASEKAYLRFYRKMGDEVIDLIAVAYADRLSALGPEITKEMVDKNINGLKKLLDGYFENKNSLKPLPKLLDGKEIMSILNIGAGPMLGEIVNSLKEAQISSVVNTKDEAIDYIKKLKL